MGKLVALAGVAGGIWGMWLAQDLPPIHVGYATVVFLAIGIASGLLALRQLPMATWGLALAAFGVLAITLIWFDWRAFRCPAALLLAGTLLPMAPCVLRPAPGGAASGSSTRPWRRDVCTATAMALRQLTQRLGAPKEAVQALGVITIAIGTYNFWFTAYYEPSTRTPTLTLASSLELGGAQSLDSPGGRLQAVTTTVTLKNPTRGPVEVLASAVNVSGVRMDPLSAANRDLTDPRRRSAALQNLDTSYREMLKTNLVPHPDTGYVSMFSGGHASRHSVPGRSFQVYAAVLHDQGFWFEPGEEVSSTHVFHVLEGEYDYLSLDYNVFVGRRSMMLTTLKPTYETEQGEILTWSVKRQTLFKGEVDFVASAETAHMYGVAFSSSRQELPLWKDERPDETPAAQGHSARR